ncbi:hypothetical protein M409DRAFT_49504 [Zasmidium cellare ATCC 36951]|uniref:Uncharacterized protein n=1 Tax=Zasmidium cellare ATCC 36951 TaxID=1080233 RepID=A0A6A6D1F2_ZASCE|nr:uncharacterized protein M409DRAFT_49504 [Zasmidium cellare ATCC 36951]KAF2173005.1 hypothetical protein M409DRAFT_49504 [Zasmidium cellare ATCC 36951]
MSLSGTSPALSRKRKSFGLPNRIIRNFQKDCRSLHMAGSFHRQSSVVGEGGKSHEILVGCPLDAAALLCIAHSRLGAILGMGERSGGVCDVDKDAMKQRREGGRQVVVRRARRLCCTTMQAAVVVGGRCGARFPDRRTVDCSLPLCRSWACLTFERGS